MSASERFHEVANDSLVHISEHLWPGAKLALVVYEPGKPDLDIVLKDQGIDLNEVLSTLRRAGLSIDGDNAYKRDLCDCIVGAMAFGAQNRNQPPDGHWGQRFWDIGREERMGQEELLRAAKKVLAGFNARIDEATATGAAVPVFEGIAALHAAITKASQ